MRSRRCEAVRHGARARVAGAAPAVALLLSACALLPGGRPAAHCPVALPAVASLPDVRLRERVRFEREPGEPPARVDVVLEKRGADLRMVGLTPAGTRAFAWVQQGSRREVDRGVARWLGVEPELALDAVARARLIGWGEAPLADGEHAAVQGDEERVDVWRRRRRVFRRFAAPGAPPAVRIDYRSVSERPTDGAGATVDAGDAAASRLAIVENDWCGYTARILTLSEEALR